MPIYEYRCTSCGMQQEFLRKVSDAPLTTCPKCGKESLSKMVTAAGFQLKGTGWYATDFKDGAKRPSPTGDKAARAGDAAPAATADGTVKTESKTESKTETAAPTTSAAPVSAAST